MQFSLLARAKSSSGLFGIGEEELAIVQSLTNMQCNCREINHLRCFDNLYGWNSRVQYRFVFACELGRCPSSINSLVLTNKRLNKKPVREGFQKKNVPFSSLLLLGAGGGRRRCERTTRLFHKSCFYWSVPV